MLELDDRAAFVGRRARIAFRTTHIDRAGETSSVRAVDTEIVELDSAGAAILVTDDGLHFRFPAAGLARGSDGTDYVGGQELIRDFHSALEPVRLRWLAGAELAAALAESTDARSVNRPKRPKSRKKLRGR